MYISARLRLLASLIADPSRPTSCAAMHAPLCVSLARAPPGEQLRQLLEARSIWPVDIQLLPCHAPGVWV